jgi:tripeptidyl-peptidase-1
MHRLTLIATYLLAASAAATFVQKRGHPNPTWTKLSPAPKDEVIRLHIALPQADNGAAIEQYLLRASDPSSTSFRDHLCKDQVAKLSEPKQACVREVEDWLARNGLLRKADDSMSHVGGIYDVQTTIEQAERLLHTTYFRFRSGDGQGKVINRVEAYHLPEAVAECVDFVTPTTTFPFFSHPAEWQEELRKRTDEVLVRSRDSNSSSNNTKNMNCSGPNDLATPTCIRAAYDITFDGLNYTTQPNRTSFAVYGTEGASFKNSNLQAYLQAYNSPAAEAGVSYRLIGPKANTESTDIAPKFETSLTTQAFLGLAYPQVQDGIFYNYGGVFGPQTGATYDNFVMFLQQLISNDTVPSVVSTSESAPENLFDADYARRLCTMMAQVGLRGVSLLYSAGNNGPNGDGAGGHHKDIFEPKFPASCPWITTVGGTTNLGDEEAATQATIPTASKLGYTSGGGGFSNLFARPNYQSEKVQSYINNYIPASYKNESGFNASGRGYPDVAAFSTQFPTFVDGFMLPIGGTSAATPTWAAVISLLNDYEAFHGRKPLGFLNPWLYSLNGLGLKDIVKGGNNVGACSLVQGCTLPKVLGFNVTEGWDAVTGLGSPKFRELVRALDSGLPM